MIDRFYHDCFESSASKSKGKCFFAISICAPPSPPAVIKGAYLDVVLHMGTRNMDHGCSIFELQDILLLR